MKQKVDSLWDTGIISVSDSPCASPVLLIERKNDFYRLICDYRKLNIKTQPFPYPFTFNFGLLGLVGGQFYSWLDLCSGYWQMYLNTRYRPKTRLPSALNLVYSNGISFHRG